MSEVADRVVGIESEYGLSYAFSKEQLAARAAVDLPKQVWGADAGGVIDTVLDDYLPEGLPHAGESCSSFLGNGMRLYAEVGNHPEAAGAEVTSIKDLIDGDLAADRLVWRAFRDAYRAGAIQNFMLLRRVLDGKGVSWGRHENYRMERQAVTRDEDDRFVSHAKLRPLAGFLAIRSLTGGAGCLNEGIFWTGQKITTAVTDISTETTSAKPLVNTRDEPLGGTAFRQHVVSVDFTSPHVTARNVEMTSLVLRMMELGVAPDLTITEPELNWAFFARRAAVDLSFSYAAEVNGQTMTTLNVHEAFLERAEAMSTDMLSPAEQRGREKWNRIYERLVAVRNAAGEGHLLERAERVQQAIATHLRGEVDWADRLQYIGGDEPWTSTEPPFAEGGVALINKRAWGAQADIKYDVIGTGGGMAPAYMERLKTPQAAEWVDMRRIERRILHAPPGGRAALREKFLYALGNDPIAKADWERLGYFFVKGDQLEPEYVRLTDPTLSEDERVDALIAKALQAQPASHALRRALLDKYYSDEQYLY